MPWRFLLLILLVPFLIGSDSRSDTRVWADFLEEWLYGASTDDDDLARIEELQERIFEADALARSSTIYFASGSDVLDAEAQDTLRAFARRAARLPGVHFHLAGHADAVPIYTRFHSNQELSRARAERARSFLVHEGFAPELLSASGYADTVPVASNANAEGRAQNRRVDVRFLPAALIAPAGGGSRPRGRGASLRRARRG